MLEVGCARRHVGALNDASHARWSRASFSIEATNVVENIRTIFKMQNHQNTFCCEKVAAFLFVRSFLRFLCLEICRKKKCSNPLILCRFPPPHRLPSVIIEDSLLPFFPSSLPSSSLSFSSPQFVSSLYAGSFPSSFFLAKPIFHPWSKTLRHLLESSSIREYSVSAPKQKAVVGELVRHSCGTVSGRSRGPRPTGWSYRFSCVPTRFKPTLRTLFLIRRVCCPAAGLSKSNLANYTGTLRAFSSANRHIDRLIDWSIYQ